MFTAQAFRATLLQDNPTYERVRTSDLHALVALVTGGGFSAGAVVGEMRKIPADKWKKYGRTRRYLIKELPGLATILNVGLVNFRTTKLEALPGGNIIHEATWDCSTGIKDDLADWHVREKVMWGVALPESVQYLDPAYRVAGQHTGVGNAATSLGNVQNMSDTHDAKGAWAPAIATYASPAPLVYKVSQVYQYSSDNKLTWHDIPNSTYEIVRTASGTPAKKVKLAILKRSIPPNARTETKENALEF